MPTHCFRSTVAALACIFLYVQAIPASAQTARDVKVSGVGTRKCTEWQQWREARNGEAQATALEWAQGFISGHNVYSRGGANSIVADNKILLPLVDSFCQRNPDSPLFAAVVTADDVVHGKPSPDMFLLAARLLGVPPRECLVFEDAEPGLQGAAAAGMQVVHVPSRRA